MEKIQTEKLGADCSKKLKEMVQKAAKKEKRSLSNFIRISCEQRAEKILKNK